MNLEQYQTLTGITVSTANTSKVEATITRTQKMLETLLGFTLFGDSTNLYNELGKTDRDCFCPSVDLENLEPADSVIGAYRLYRYREDDKYFHIDPFSKLHKVKLVYIKQGDAPNGVTIKTYDWDDIRVQVGKDGISKYIEHCENCLCKCSCDNCVQLAVDADWLWTNYDSLPDDMKYLWADMITFYSDDKKSDIRSESIDTHSYTRFDNNAPEMKAYGQATLRKYAGPYGSVAVMPL